MLIFGYSEVRQGTLSNGRHEFTIDCKSYYIIKTESPNDFVIVQIRDELNDPGADYIPKRHKLQEAKESLATQKLLYPSKFRKDPYRRKLVKFQQSESMTKLPSIMKSRSGTSGQMLMSMIGMKEKRLPRNVSEAAFKLVTALDKIEEF